MDQRLKNLISRMHCEELDGLIVNSEANISYLTRHPSRDSRLLVSKKKIVYFTDPRYTEEAKKQLKGISIRNTGSAPPFPTIAQTCRKLRLKRVGFEEKSVSYAEYRCLKKELGKKPALVATSDLIEEMRELKDAQELGRIRKALVITAKTLKFAGKIIKSGAKETEVAARLEEFMRLAGGSGPSFKTIVASGGNSGFPHHIPGARKIGRNDLVLVDLGVDYQGYKSDLTRIFFLGRIKHSAARIYEILLEAQRRAISRVKPGVQISEIDAAARDYISQKGFGPNFSHSLGHGVGRQIHENPKISSKADGILKPGMVLTIEPAIYLPGKFGIRIEDMVLVTKKGYEVLSVSVNK